MNVIDQVRRLNCTLQHLRMNGLMRSLYLIRIHLFSPILEPLRRLVASFLMLPAKRRKQVLLSFAVVFLIFVTLIDLWHVAPLFLLLLLVMHFRHSLYVKLRASFRVRHWQTHRDELLKTGAKGYVVTLEHLGLQEEEFLALKEELERSPEVIIADIDQDGFLLSRFGTIPGAAHIDRENFLQRKRFTLNVVALDGKIGVKKSYRGNTICFVNELEILHSLAGRCNVPAILDVDFNNLTITLSYIPGPVIREELAKRGAVLRNRDVDGNPDFMHLASEEKRLKRIEQGKKVLYNYVDQELVDAIFAQLKKIHKIGICISDVKFGNIIIEKDSGEPYFIDFDHSVHYGRPRGLRWQVRRDFDIERFNLHFDTEKLTRGRILRRIRELSDTSPIHPDGGIHFGYGVTMGKTWDVDSGEGRWHYILKPNLPPLSGKRVLDLGCRNAFFSLKLLRHGARKVVGIEDDAAWIEQAKFIKEGFEWADCTTYNFKIIQARISDIPTMELGRFDLVTALSSLCYMDKESLDEVIRHVSSLTDCFVVQWNIDPRDYPPEIHHMASIDYSTEALHRNGFRVKQVVAPPEYKHALLIGNKQ